tara:strand:+ start:369 stop:608 length:240 start_codon:yes stop_codon:yes gene_type:complete
MNEIKTSINRLNSALANLTKYENTIKDARNLTLERELLLKKIKEFEREKIITIENVSKIIKEIDSLLDLDENKKVSSDG